MVQDESDNRREGATAASSPDGGTGNGAGSRADGSRFLGVIRAVWIPILVFGGYAGAFLNATFDLRSDEYFYPRMLIAAIFAVVVWQTLSNLALARKSQAWVTRDQLVAWWFEWRRSVYTMSLVLAFLIGIWVIGFYPAAAIFAIALMLILGVRPVWMPVLVTAIILAGSYGLFTVFLNLRLP